MGNPTSGDSRTTDAHGQAVLPYPRRDIMDFDTTHPAFRVFHPNDKPQRDGDRVLLYMRRPPRIVLVLPPDFTGPLPISSCAGNRYDRRQPLYRFAINPDPFIPTPVSQIQDGTVRLEEIEAERTGAVITPGAQHQIPPRSTSGPLQMAPFTNMAMSTFSSLEPRRNSPRARKQRIE